MKVYLVFATNDIDWTEFRSAWSTEALALAECNRLKLKEGGIMVSHFYTEEQVD